MIAVRAALSGLAALFLACGVAAQPPLTLGGVTVAAGLRADITLAVPPGEHDPATIVPVTVLRGARPGPTLLMVAGVHGYEFAPILAAQRLAEEVQPAQLAGSLLLVRVAHVPALEHRSPYVNPFDRKNLNRSFPGAAKGTQAERIAWVLSSQVIPKADFVFDVHSGDGAEWLAPFVGVYGGPLASDFDSALAVGEAMGFANLIRYDMETQEQVDTGRSLNRQAVAQGLPTVLVEIGENGRRNPADVDAIVAGLKSALAVLGMSAGAPMQRTVALRCFAGTQSVSATHSGIWSPHKARGRWVRQGEVLGSVRDYFGSVLETLRAPAAGYALYGLAGPPVRQGESVVTIAEPDRRAGGGGTCATNAGRSTHREIERAKPHR